MIWNEETQEEYEIRKYEEKQKNDLWEKIFNLFKIIFPHDPPTEGQKIIWFVQTLIKSPFLVDSDIRDAPILESKLSLPPYKGRAEAVTLLALARKLSRCFPMSPEFCEIYEQLEKNIVYSVDPGDSDLLYGPERELMTFLNILLDRLTPDTITAFRVSLEVLLAINVIV